MSKITKKIIKSLLLTSVLSLVQTNMKAQNPLLPQFEPEDDDSDQMGEIKRKVLKNVVKVNPSGRMSMVDGHYSHKSHSSHKSHYSGSGGHSSHSSHSSHYSSSHSSHYSSSSSHYSSTVSGLYSTPSTTTTPKIVAKTPATYSLGDRTIKIGIYGADVDKLVNLLVSNYYLKKASFSKMSNYTLYDAKIVSAVKHFQNDAGLPPTGDVDSSTAIALQAWDNSKTTIDLGFRDMEDGISGYDVTQLVTLLTSAGYAPESTKMEYKSGNAVFNSELAMALKMFQAYNHLDPTGILDTQTINKLKVNKK